MIEHEWVGVQGCMAGCENPCVSFPRYRWKADTLQWQTADRGEAINDTMIRAPKILEDYIRECDTTIGVRSEGEGEK